MKTDEPSRRVERLPAPKSIGNSLLAAYVKVWNYSGLVLFCLNTWKMIKPRTGPAVRVTKATKKNCIEIGDHS